MHVCIIIEKGTQLTICLRFCLHRCLQRMFADLQLDSPAEPPLGVFIRNSWHGGLLIGRQQEYSAFDRHIRITAIRLVQRVPNNFHLNPQKNLGRTFYILMDVWALAGL